jgi:hypothetical protein
MVATFVNADRADLLLTRFRLGVVVTFLNADLTDWADLGGSAFDSPLTWVVVTFLNADLTDQTDLDGSEKKLMDVAVKKRNSDPSKSAPSAQSAFKESLPPHDSSEP